MLWDLDSLQTLGSSQPFEAEIRWGGKPRAVAELPHQFWRWRGKVLECHRAAGAAGAGGHHAFGGSHLRSLPPELGPPTLSPGTANKILPSISSLKTISLLRMGFLEQSR